MDAYTIQRADAAGLAAARRLLGAGVDQITTDDPAALGAALTLPPPAPGDGVKALLGMPPLRQRAAVSSQIVTGPSLTSASCIAAPKTPVATGTLCARMRSMKSS